MIHVADTHGFLWFICDDSRLSPRADAIFSDPAAALVIPATVLAEACWIAQTGRLPLTAADVLAAVDADPRITVWSLDRNVIARSNSLTTIPEMHDRQIVATAVLLQEQGQQVALITNDLNITASGLVPVLW